MRRFDYTLSTPAAPERVVAYLADLRNLEEWVREVRSVRLDGGEALVRIGSGLGPSRRFRYGVETDERAGTVVARGEHRSMTAVDRWTVRPATGGGSQVDYVGEYELHGPSKLLGPVAQLLGEGRAGSLRDALGGRLDRLA